MVSHSGFRSISLVVAVALLACAFFAAGCGTDKAGMQAFADGVTDVMTTLESKPEVAEAGREASMKYTSSGFTDLESAKKAEESYRKSSENDEAAIEELKKLEKPDDEAKKIASDLQLGVIEVDEGNRMFADSLAKAPAQTVEERAAEAGNVEPELKLYSEGMGRIVGALAALMTYIKSNGLEGYDEAKKWHDKIEGEKEGVDAYLKQAS